MFFTDETVLDLAFETARARLADHRLLAHASADAYAVGAAAFPGGAPYSRIAGSRYRELTAPPGHARLACRWEVADPGEEPFPVLDADILLIPAGAGRCLLRMTGVYRSSPAITPPGADHDLARQAAVTVGSFLARISALVTGPALAVFVPRGPDGQALSAPPSWN